ncbi:TOMM system kinase/cyclase fusion protein [Paraburkholderia megapolitana]|uniref:TOMM system kinase/cyclase fusion protein n=1 Tax=Paraburkholderia megapolitana TaxID=420953 RepID=A0A1I3DP90_9BURK|nr:TOMM system kinase/cyclase fusion protein [Paraburkholderia megapolitana]QDQ79689.1 TOMM system kinase/cyclase fusion protein [Paraburkholderia megapolitana]SFH88368.1 TOMM system kinase/cyclase fusion protein [Paraburkholderia megapolitana]
MSPLLAGTRAKSRVGSDASPVLPTAALPLLPPTLDLQRSAAPSALPNDVPEVPRYQLGALLGEGATGSVYKATRLDTGHTVAVKLLREDATQPAAERLRLRARFQRETELCERLHHPHVVALLDKGETPDGRLFAVFEFVPGRTLRDMLTADGALSAVTTGLLMTQVLDGLASAHRQGVVHRDLKPQNVMVTLADGEPQAKILDFGIGALLPDARRSNERTERTLMQLTDVLGSPQYCSPEQLRNEEPTLRSDLYAWGLLVIECLTGHAVMQGASVAEILYQQLSPVDVALPPAIAAHPLGTVLRRALNKDPRQRAGSAEELGRHFREIHFPALVGELNYRPARLAVSSAVAADMSMGVARNGNGAGSTPAAAAVAGERRQVTTLCCSVTISSDGSVDAAALADEDAVSVNRDALDAYAAQWLTQCSDIAIRYGGQVAGTLGDTLLFYFGYPDGIDRAARRAARAALDMVHHASHAQATRTNEADSTAVWHVDVAAAIHVGTVFSHALMAPIGATQSEAMRLQRLASAGQILLSHAARRSLERHADYVPTPLYFATSGVAARPVYALLGERREQAQFDSLDQGVPAPMIGRDRERAVLLQAWHAVVERQPHGDTRRSGRRQPAKLVIGEAGIGKTRLVHELCETVRLQHQAFARCVCLPEQMNQALFPILRFVKEHWQIDVDGARDTALAVLETMIAPLDCDHAAAQATLAAWLGLSGDIGGLRWSGMRQQQTLFDVLRQLLASLGNGAPVLLVVEDVQWIDCASADFLETLRQHPDSASIWLVLTSRPEQLARWRGAADRLVLRRLSRSDTRSLIATLFTHDDIDPASLDFLANRTAGIPLFVEEIIRELVVSGAATEPGRLLSSLTTSEHYPLPGTLRDMLELAFDRVDGARDTAQLAATIGLEVDAQLLAAASPHDGVVLEEHLRRLLEARVVYAQHRLDGVSYAFRHALICEAAYESMPAPVRRRNHEQVARALNLRAGGAARVAHHFAQAGMFAEAVPHGIQAARRALERALHDDAIRYAEAVCGWLAHSRHAERDQDAARIDLVLTHACMARFGWADPQVRVHAERLLGRVDCLDDAQLAASALWSLATYHHVASDRAAVRQIGAQLTDLARTSGDAGIRVSANAMRGMGLWIDGHYRLARTALEAALSEYDVLRDADHRRIFGLDTRAWSMAALASVMWCLEDGAEAALTMAREAVYRATCTDHLPTLGVTLMYLARMQQCAGDRDSARDTSAAILRLSRNYGLSAVERYAAIIHAWSDDDRAAVVAHVDALRASGCLLGLTYYASLIAEIDAARGEWDAALAGIDRCLAWCESLDERYYEAELLLKKAHYLDRAGAPGHAAAAAAVCRRALAAAQRGAMSRVIQKAQDELRRLQPAV